MTWSMEEVCEVFKSIRLQQYCEVIQTENITGFLLADLFLNSGLADLGMSALHQARLKQYFHTMNETIAKESEAAPASEPPSKEAPPGEPHESPKKEGEPGSEAGAEDRPEAAAEAREDAAAAGAAKPAEAREAPPQEGASERQRRGPREEAAERRGAEPAGAPQEAAQSRAFDKLLFEAVQADNEQEVCTLLAKRANPNATNAAGEFPLLDGVMFGSHCVVAMLVFAKADLAKCTPTGITALDVCNKKDTVMTELLTRPVSDMALDSPYAQYHRSDEWREARHHFTNARNFINGTRTKLQHYVGPGIPEALAAPADDGPGMEALPRHTEFNRWMRMIENK